MTSKREELHPTNGNQKSFYGKAKIERLQREIKLYSYQTHVASIFPFDDDKDPEVYNMQSKTTTTHIRAFLDRFNYATGTKKEIKEMYFVSRKEENSGFDLGKMAAMFSVMAGMGATNLKEKNERRADIYRRTPSIIFPDNWDTLTEEEKEKRLDKIQEIGLSKNK